jgi:hypothetical protein
VPGVTQSVDWHGEVSLRQRVIVDKLTPGGPLHQGFAHVQQGLRLNFFFFLHLDWSLIAPFFIVGRPWQPFSNIDQSFDVFVGFLFFSVPGDWLEKLNGQNVTHRDLNDILSSINSREIVSLQNGLLILNDPAGSIFFSPILKKKKVAVDKTYLRSVVVVVVVAVTFGAKCGRFRCRRIVWLAFADKREKLP